MDREEAKAGDSKKPETTQNNRRSANAKNGIASQYLRNEGNMKVKMVILQEVA